MGKSTARACTKGIHSMYGIFSHFLRHDQSQRTQFNRPFIFFINYCLIKCENNE